MGLILLIWIKSAVQKSAFCPVHWNQRALHPRGASCDIQRLCKGEQDEHSLTTCPLVTDKTGVRLKIQILYY